MEETKFIHERSVTALIVVNTVLFSGCFNGEVRVWNLKDETLICKIKYNEPIYTLNYHELKSGLLLFTGLHNRIEVEFINVNMIQY
jgi:hypothetical protein